MTTIELIKFKSADGSDYLMGDGDDSRMLMAHLVGIACCNVKDERKLSMLADAHGWRLNITEKTSS